MTASPPAIDPIQRGHNVATTESPDTRQSTGSEPGQVLPPSWADSRRFVPRRFVQPALSFMRAEASGGTVMLFAALLAIVWANSPLGDTYFQIFETHIEIAFGEFHFHHLSELTVRDWINDALMVVFFFVVGLEIKRELVVGELRDPRAAALPAIAALGGMVVPAGIYLFFNLGLDSGGGWGIPMATDIAFAAGIAAMVGSRVPVSAKLFLLALAIVDDLGAILVIALFYTDEVSFAWLVAAVVGLGVVWFMNRVDMRPVMAYVVVGAFVWLAVLESGVHATIAGVALALMTPVQAFYDPRRFSDRARQLVNRVDSYLPGDRNLRQADHHTLERVQHQMSDLQRLSRDSLPPLDRLEFALTPWSSFFVIPVFALANAGVRIPFASLADTVVDPVFLGIALGLLVGKTAGVGLFAWAAVKLGIGRMPMRTTWHHMIGMGMLAGIGFTVALFVASLSFETGEPNLDAAKIGIFTASLIAGVAGFVWLKYLGPDPEELDRNRDGVLDARQQP